MKYKNILEIENILKNSVRGFDLDFDDNLTKIKKDFLNQKIKEFNKFNIENHILSDKINTFSYKEISFKQLLWDKTFNFKDIENKIKEVFKKYNKENRIKEVQFYLNLTKIFNKDNKKYFSLYDLQKETTETEIKNKINNLKEFCLSCIYLKDNYYISKGLNNLKEFLNLLLNIDINFKYEYSIKDFKVYEKQINESNKNIKIKIFKEWLYISFSNKETENRFKEFLINQTLKRLGGL